MAKKTVQSVEPQIADLANSWLKAYKLDYKLEQEPLNIEIDQALNDYYSKSGGNGGNRPDVKLLLQGKNLINYPILIEYKGYKDKLVKLDTDGKIANKTSKGLPDFRNINSYAVNGAVHYANAILHYTSYTDIIAIGMTGYINELGKLEYEIGVYFVSKSNFGIGQKVADYTDLSFLREDNFDKFIERVKRLQMTQEEIDKLKEHREREISISLTKLNNDIYQNEKGLSERDRVYLVAASIIATLGVPGKVAALEKSELKSSVGSFGSAKSARYKGESPGKIKAPLNERLSAVKWGKFELGELFDIESTLSFNIDKLVEGTEYDYVTRTSTNQCVLIKLLICPSIRVENKLGGWNVVKDKWIQLPELEGKIDFDFMENFISAIQKLVIKDVIQYINRKLTT